MPTYSYQCSNCNYSFSKFLRMSEHSLPEQEQCPNCKSNTIIQVINNSNPLVDPYALGRIHPSEDWQFFMKTIKQRNPGSNINCR